MKSACAGGLLGGLIILCSGAGAVLASERPDAGAPNAGTEHEYRLWYRNYDSPPIRTLVALAFQKTPEYGPFKITRSPEMPQGRVIRELEQQGSTLVDIANVATSTEREDKLRAIPLPIDGGLLGFRVCVVMEETLPMFEGINSISDLQAAGIRIGQGTHWPDTAVLEANGVTVVTHSRYEILFRMLENHRFECFARGVSEVLFDLKVQHNMDLVIEPDLLLAYPMPSYFFVSRRNHETAQRLQLGMERAIHDGSFGRYLDHFYGQALKELALEKRKVLVLNNPYLTEESWAIGRHTLTDLQRRISLLSRSDKAGSDFEP